MLKISIYILMNNCECILVCSQLIPHKISELLQFLKSINCENLNVRLKLFPLLLCIQDPRVIDMVYEWAHENPILKQRLHYIMSYGYGIFKDPIKLIQLDRVAEISKLLFDPKNAAIENRNDKRPILEIPISENDISESECPSENEHYSVCVHPLTGEKITTFQVLKIYETLNRPMLVELVPSETKLIIKRGNDLKNGEIIQTAFGLLNNIFASHFSAEIGRPMIPSYQIICVEKEWGFIEYIPNTISLLELEKKKCKHVQDLDKFISTLAGNILASYILGLNDRHPENTLFSLDTNELIPIDFDFILGIKAPGIDNYSIPLSFSLYQFLVKKKVWNQFCRLCLQGFLAVREVYPQIAYAFKILFSQIRPPKFIDEYFRHTLQLGKSKKKASKRFLHQLLHAPLCTNNRIKMKCYSLWRKMAQKHPKQSVKYATKKLTSKPSKKPGRRWGHHAKVLNRCKVQDIIKEII